MSCSCNARASRTDASTRGDRTGSRWFGGSGAAVVLTLLAGLVSMLCAGCGSGEGRVRDRARNNGVKADPVGALLLDPDVAESSGLAASAHDRQVLWTHNDSGSRPILYAINLRGETVGRILLDGVQPTDWEDLASLRWGNQPALLVADTGDDPLKPSRQEYVLHIVPEPRVNARPSNDQLTLRPAASIPFRYEDGPHDCEAVAVDGMQVWLMVKSSELNASLYRLDLTDRPPQVAKRVGQVPVTAPTSLAFSPDGQRAAVLNYGGVLEFDRSPGEPWDKALAGRGRFFDLPSGLVQAEALCYGTDGRTIFVTSEGAYAPLVELNGNGIASRDRRAVAEGERLLRERLREPRLPRVPPMYPQQ